MNSNNLTEEHSNDFRYFFPGEEISCMGIFWATIMTLMVLFQLSIIW